MTSDGKRTEAMADMMRNLWQSDLSVPREQVAFASKKERIDAFNKTVAESHKQRINHATTDNFIKKISSAKNAPLSSLRPIGLLELEVGKIHRGRALYCRIITDVLKIKSAMVLVEDNDGEITQLAIYGLTSTSDLTNNRRVTVLEPFFKLMADGTTGVRVDNPADISFDKEPNEYDATSSVDEIGRISVEERLNELVVQDESVGIQKLHRQLLQEGYRIKKDQVRALKKAIQKMKINDESGEKKTKLIPIISERCPEKDRVLSSAVVLRHRKEGNSAFKAKRFEEAERHYSAALKSAGDIDQSNSEESVHLWQLYGNRAAARLKIGKLDEALRDCLFSNRCSPLDVVKPLLRCAEAMAALGMRKEMEDLLEATVTAYPESSELVLTKQIALAPKLFLRVGVNQQYRSIAAAVLAAPSGAEILVDPGVYCEPLVLARSVTIRCAQILDDNAALCSLEASDETMSAEIRVNGNIAVYCTGSAGSCIHIIGFRIVCNTIPAYSAHALYVVDGVVVARNCAFTSCSGPVCAVNHNTSRLIMQSCAVVGGAQGGILVAEKATLRMQQVHCCRHAASGLELRTGGTAFADACHFYDNGRQGIIAWMAAGLFTAQNCDIHSNTTESGMLVEEAEVVLESCRIYGNGAAGLVAQNKGIMTCIKCEVHDNVEGILIQDICNATVEECDVFSNRSNGIFIGYDHRGGSVKIINNSVYDNRFKGILIGNLGKVVVRGNTESGNQGLPPNRMLLPNKHLGRHLSPKYEKRIQKNRETIEKARRQRGVHDMLDVGMMGVDFVDVVSKAGEKIRNDCCYCKQAPPSQVEYKKCSRCKVVSYCSPKCQKLHWPMHKKTCAPEAAKYPSFVDRTKSVE